MRRLRRLRHADRAHVATQRELAQLRARSSRPTRRNFIAQPTLALSTCPTCVEEGIAPRHVDLRPFVLSGATASASCPAASPAWRCGRGRWWSIPPRAAAPRTPGCCTDEKSSADAPTACTPLPLAGRGWGGVARLCTGVDADPSPPDPPPYPPAQGGGKICVRETGCSRAPPTTSIGSRATSSVPNIWRASSTPPTG